MRVLIVALAAASALTILAGTAATLWRMRSDALTNAGTRVTDLTLILAEQTERALDQIDLVLESMVEEAKRFAAAGPLAPDRALHDALAAQLRGVRAPQLGALGLINADGNLVASNGPFPPPVVSYRDRERFRAHRDGPPSPLVVGPPGPAPLLQGEVGVPLSKRIDGPGGGFAGVAFAVARLAYFVELYRGLNLGPGGTVRLHRRDGVLLASFSADDQAAGQTFAASVLFRDAPPAGEALVVDNGPEQSIVALRALADYPLLVTVSAPRAHVLAAWRRDAWIFGTIAGLAAAFVAGLAVAVERRLAADARLRGEIREGAARLDAVIRSAMDAIITVDKDQRVVLFNAAAERMFGLAAGQALGAPLERFIPEPLRAAHRAHLERFGRTGETARRMGQQQALSALRADGTEFRIEASISHATVSGEPLFTVILRDITERLAAEARVREGETRLEAILRSAMDGIVTIDAGQRIALFNAAAERMFRCTADEALGQPLERFIPERFRAAHRGHVDRFGRTGETSRRMGDQQALWALRKDGTEFPIEASISHATVAGQHLYTVILRDITARLRAEEELRLAHDELRELAQAMHEVREAERTRIARELHDELGQALTALKMDVDLLGSTLPEDRGDLRERTEAMRGLLDSTVATTRRISADLRPLVLDDLGLGAAAEWLVQSFSQRTQVPCSLHVDAACAQLGEPYASALFRIMQESLTNVARHARASRVSVRLERVGDDAVLTVLDDGVGMDRSARPNPRSFGLRGIGERALLLGGSAEIASRRGAGTTLVARIPLAGGGRQQAA